jgi:DNA/RNA-binding protein KIN17
MSEGHLRQMRLFAQNPNQILDSFSSQFEKGFMQILSHSHGTKRVFANRVYQEYIADKNHVHMNSTVWTTLTGFCKYLGKEGKCIVDETEKGWYIQYIDRDPQTLMKQQQREERKQLEVNEDEIQKRMIENQIKAAFEKQREREEKAEVQIENDSALAHKPIQVKFNYALTANEKKRGAVTAFGVNDDDGEEVDSKSNSQTGGTRHFGRKAGAIELLMKEQEDRKRFKVSHDQQRQNIEATMSPDISDTWLMEGILVKIISKKAYNGDYYKQKGSILDVRRNPKGGFEAEILFSINGEESNKIFSESDLETVVPKVSDVLFYFPSLLCSSYYSGR